MKPLRASGASASNQRGRLSSPVQRRLTNTEIDDLAAQYCAGSTIQTLAREFGLHRTTVMDHLERLGIARRTPRKLTDPDVIDAAKRYASGSTLAEIADQLGVALSTLTRELRQASITIRPRGRPATG